ncbi:MAG: hypothetical protein FWF37_01710 [Chloroflexi bacterium]|nr:hypothetical protein [Chloroflexota bacterium]
MNIINRLFEQYSGSYPLGFIAKSQENKRRPVIFALDGGEADAVCVRHEQDIEKIKAEIKGVYLDSPCSCKECYSASVPFVVFAPHNMPLRVQFNENTAKIALVEENADMISFSGYAALPTDAFMIKNDADKLTWAHISIVKRYSALNKPVIMQVAADATVEELQNLYKAGARAFAVRGGEASAVYQTVQQAKWQVNKEKKDAFISTVIANNSSDAYEEDE